MLNSLFHSTCFQVKSSSETPVNLKYILKKLERIGTWNIKSKNHN